MNPILTTIASIVDAIEHSIQINSKDVDTVLEFIQSPIREDATLNMNDLHQLGCQLWNSMQTMLSSESMKDEHILSCTIIAIRLIDIGWLENGIPIMKAIQILQMICKVCQSFEDVNILKLPQLVNTIEKHKDILKQTILQNSRDLTLRSKKELCSTYVEYLSIFIDELISSRVIMEELAILLKSDAVPIEDWLYLIGKVHDYCVAESKSSNFELVIEILQPLVIVLHNLQGIFYSNEGNKLSQVCYSTNCILLGAYLEQNRREDARTLYSQIVQKYGHHTENDKFFAFLALKLDICTENFSSISTYLMEKKLWKRITSSGWVDILLFIEARYSKDNGAVMIDIWEIVIDNITSIDDWLEVFNQYLRFCTYNGVIPRLQDLKHKVISSSINEEQSQSIEILFGRTLQVAASLFAKFLYEESVEWSKEALRLAFIAEERGIGKSREMIRDSYMQVIRCQICVLDKSPNTPLDDLIQNFEEAKKYTSSETEEILLVQFIIQCHTHDIQKLEKTIQKWKNIKGNTADLLITAGRFALLFENRNAAINVLEKSLENISESDFETKSSVIRCLLSLYRNFDSKEGSINEENKMKKVLVLLNQYCDYVLVQTMKLSEVTWLCKSIWNTAVDMYKMKYYVHTYDLLESLYTICMWREEILELTAIRLDSCRLRSQAALSISMEKEVSNHQQYLHEALKILAHGRSIDAKFEEIKQNVSVDLFEKILKAFASLFVMELKVRIAAKDPIVNLRNLVKAACMHEYVKTEHLSLICSALEDAHQIDLSQAQELALFVFRTCLKSECKNIVEACYICISVLNTSNGYNDSNIELFKKFTEMIPTDSSELRRDQMEYICTKFYNNSAKAYRLNFFHESDQWLKLAEILIRIKVLNDWSGKSEIQRLRSKLNL